MQASYNDDNICRDVMENILKDLDSTSISPSTVIEGPKCEVCAKNPPKYKCPKCSVRTCCLLCVKTHKKMNDCDGVRCKTTFVPLNKYNENNMLNDYRLLEEIARCADNNGRYISESLPNSTKGMSLQIKKAKGMNINLKLLPFTFTQHKLNSTFYHCKLQAFLWHIVWHFPTLNHSIHKKKVIDTKTIEEALSEACSSDDSGNINIQKYLDNSETCIYMKRMDLPANEIKYYKIDTASTIKSALRGKTIVEFPQFIVVLQQKAQEYENNIFEGSAPNANSAIISKKVDSVLIPPKRQKLSSNFENEAHVDYDVADSFP
ncbi:box C/D snoRNA protein 1-like [Styela clava]